MTAKTIRSFRTSYQAASLLGALVIGTGCTDPTIVEVPTPSFSVRGSVEQVHVWKTPPGSKIELRDGSGNVVREGTSDALGGLVLRKVPPGSDYEVVVPELASPNAIDVDVLGVAESQPKQEFYSSQKLKPGYNYITMRDGTKLAAYITLPGPPENGPYPTVVNYSGYSPAKPGEPIGNFSFLCADLPIICDAPSDPSALIAGLNGYATVGVNMRGTGCSGGAYDYFETLQILDGYDVIEAVAAQDWVLGHRVGMTGLSFPGISQLFVAKAHPPSLAAISPLSVIGSTHTTLRPGGIFNDGFALEWITGVLDTAAPYGQGWEQAQVDKGDTICEENQLLHDQRFDAITLAKSQPYYTDEIAAPIDPTAFVNEIDVPVFLASAYQDEQTGPYFFTLLDQFESAPLKRFTIYNGIHPDAFAPQVIVEWKAFLDLYVAQQVPVISKQVRELAPILFEQIFKTKLPLPPDRFANYPTWEDAKKAFDAEQPLRAIFDNGAAETAGAPQGTAELRFDVWPPPNTTPLRYYFQNDGSMGPMPPAEPAGSSAFRHDPEAGNRGIMAPNGDVWDPLPAYDWKQPAPEHAVVFDSAVLDSDLVMLGTASVDIWLRSPVDDADLEVNLSEIRPDGQEMYVQSGWLRASLRELAGAATELWPLPTFRQEDEKLLTNEWTSMRVGVAGFGHVFRKGSRIRIAIDTPGDSRARWRFELKPFANPVEYQVGHSSMYPSSVVFPVLTGETAKTPLPPCPSLRGQQCRTYAPYTNKPAMP